MTDQSDCKCPTCGQVLPSGLFAVDWESRIIIAGNSFAALTAQEMDIFSELYRRPGVLITKERLLSCIAPYVDDEPEIKIVDVVVCKLRKKLKPLALSIDTVWGSGYRMMPRVREGAHD